MEIKNIITGIKNREIFQTIERFEYLPYDMRFAMKVVEAIGKERNKKFVIDDENRFVYENMVRWIHADPKMKCIDPETKKVIPGRLDAGIYIAGNTGTGKSWCLEIMSAYCTIDNVQIRTGSTKRCLHWRNYRTDEMCDAHLNTGNIDLYKNMSILGIQDLGTNSEPTESVYMGNRVDVMTKIIEYRGDFTDKITLITSNLPINHKQLIDRYGVRVSSRLNEMCNYFEITGVDRRKI